VTLEELALIWAGKGMHVFPLKADKMPLNNCTWCANVSHHDLAMCACYRKGIPCHGFYAGSTDPELIHKMFAHPDAACVGIATGKSGLVVVDCDMAKPGSTEAPEWKEVGLGEFFTEDIIENEKVFCTDYELENIVHGEDIYRTVLAHKKAKHIDTYTVRTASGGVHYVYTHPRAYALSPMNRALPMVDIKTGGSYVVAAGSQTRKGLYAPVDVSWPPAEAPDWVVKRLEERAAKRSEDPDPGDVVTVYKDNAQAYLDAVLKRTCEELTKASIGYVYDEIRAATYTLAPYVNGGGLKIGVAIEALEKAVVEIPCPERVHDVERCLEGAMDKRHAVKVEEIVEIEEWDGFDDELTLEQSAPGS
jgi:hypothetical protein